LDGKFPVHFAHREGLQLAIRKRKKMRKALAQIRIKQFKSRRKSDLCRISPMQKNSFAVRLKPEKIEILCWLTI